MHFEIALKDGVFTVATGGDAQVETWLEMLEATVSHPDWRPGAAVLHDHGKLNSGALSIADIHLIANGAVELRDRYGKSRLAVIAPRDLEYGLARLWGVLVQGRWGVAGEVFRSVEDGRRWLIELPG